MGGTGPSDDTRGRSQPLVLKDEGKTGGEDLIREFCGAMRTSCWCARPRSQQSRAEPGSSPPPGLTAVCHGATTGAEQQRYCFAPAGAGARCLLPCRARYVWFHPLFFEPFRASFCRVWTQSAQVLHPGSLCNSSWLDFVVCRGLAW